MLSTIFNGRQITLEELVGRYIIGGDLGSLFHDVRIQNNAWLKNKVSVEPGESLWDALTKAAQITGQHVWLDPDGTLQIGDPFANPYHVQTPLRLMRPLNNSNNVLSLQYENDVSRVFSDIKVLSQDSNATSILSETAAQTQYDYKRLKIVTLGDVETEAEANAALEKIKKTTILKPHTDCNSVRLDDRWKTMVNGLVHQFRNQCFIKSDSQMGCLWSHFST